MNRISPKHTDMDKMPEQEPIQLLSQADTLLAEITQRTGLVPLQGETSESEQFDDVDEEFMHEMLNLDPGPLEKTLQDCFEQKSYMWTSRQRSLMWYYDNFGVVGLAYMVKEIAREELLQETKKEPLTPAFYRSKTNCIPAKRSAPPAEIQVVDSQEEQTPDQASPSALLLELKGLIDAKGSGAKSWRRIFYDWYRGGRSRMLFYLSAIPDELMRAILSGNIPERMLDPSFAQRFRRHLELGEDPGTYTIYVARRTCVPQQSTIVPPHSGKDQTGLGLTLKEVRVLHDVASRYIDLGDKDYVNTAKRVDSAIGDFQDDLDYDIQRRYGGKTDKTDFDLHGQFLKGLRSKLVKWAAELDRSDQKAALEIPLGRCFAHVGLSSNPLRRCTDHWTQSKEPSPIFGMVTAILQIASPGAFDLREHSYQIFRAVNDEDMGLVEILSSIISSAYHWDLGISYTFAGGGGKKYPSDQLLSKYWENGRRIREDGVQAQQIRASVAKIRKMGTDWQQLKSARQGDVASSKQSLVERSVRLQGTKEDVETQLLASQVRELQDALSIEA